MSLHQAERERDGIVPRHSALATAQAMLSTSQTERRIAHRYRLAAQEAERKGNRPRYQYYTLEYRKHWRRAWFYLDHARLWSSGDAS